MKLSDKHFGKRKQLYPPILRMKDILPEVKKQMRLSRSGRSQGEFLDQTWWHKEYKEGKYVLTEKYMNRYKKWWGKNKHHFKYHLEDGTLYTDEITEDDGYKCRVYIAVPPL